jgi:hypothetical protein
MDQWQSDSINELMGAMNRAQLAMKPALKDKSNPFFHSKYADLSAVWEALDPFRREGIVFTQSPMEGPDGYIVLDTQLTHISGQWIRSRLKMRLAKDDPQGAGSAITYARRYGIGSMTGIVTEEDDDGNAASMPQKERTYQAAQQHKQTAQAKIAELRVEGPARQEGGVLGTNPPIVYPQQSPDAAAPFTWRMGKHKGKPITEIPLDYLVWACTNITNEQHRQEATNEIDRLQAQDVMRFEAEQVETQ